MTYQLHGASLRQITFTLLISAGLLGLVIIPGPVSAREKADIQAKDQKIPGVKPQPKDEKKPDSKPQPKVEKKPDVKPPPAPAQPLPNPNDPGKLKEQIAALQKELAGLKLKVATLELEKLGAMVTVEKAKDGKELATVNILKKWSGDKDALQLLKNVPNLQVVYIDNGQVNDAAVAPLKELPAPECTHLDESATY